MSNKRIERRSVLQGIAGAWAGLAGSGVLFSAAKAQAKARAPKRARHIVVLDAGHGGIDPGAIGVSGIYEKEIAFDTTKLLAQELERTGRYKVVLTRDSDEFIPLHGRVDIARAAGG